MDSVLFSTILLSLVAAVNGLQAHKARVSYSGQTDITNVYGFYQQHAYNDIAALIAAISIGSVVGFGMLLTGILVCCKVFCCSNSSHHGRVIYPYSPSQSSNYTQMANPASYSSPTTAENNRPMQHVPQRVEVPQHVTQPVNPIGVPDQAPQHQINVLPQTIIAQ